MRFRQNGRTVAIEVADRAALIEHLKAEFARWPDLDHLDFSKLKAAYSHESAPTNDGRPGWGPVWLVTLKGYGVVGWSDMPLD